MQHSDPTDDSLRRNGAHSAAPAQRWLNLGVLAHVDAGKTSLTEALLHAGGALEHPGRVDDGTTQTDTLSMERRRGITIRTAVASFTVGDVTVNLVDTPGHPDFIAEVDRSLAVLDGAVLVLSAVEGVQAQSRILFRALRRLGVPTIIMINKIDRTGADPERVVESVRRRLTSTVLPLGHVRDPGTSGATYVPRTTRAAADVEQLTAELADLDDAVLDGWVNHDQLLAADDFWVTLRRLTRSGAVQPVLFGSAVTRAGVSELMDVVTSLFPVQRNDPDAAMTGQVFKIERSAAGERVCTLRLRTGSLAVRDHVNAGPREVGQVTRLEVHAPGGPILTDSASAGQVVRAYGLSGARLGDHLGDERDATTQLNFPPPALETTIVGKDPDQHRELHAALAELADIDPLIALRPADRPGELRIKIYGEIQQQVIADTLALEHGIDVSFGSTRVVCVERPAGVGHAIRHHDDPDHLYDATLGVRVEPNEPGAGVDLRLDVGRTSTPLHVYSTIEGFQEAISRYLEKPLADGPNGWQVTDVRVTVTDSGYVPPAPSPAAVRHTTAIVVAEAIRRAGTVVCEPIDRFRIEAPSDTVSTVLGLLGRHGAVPDTPEATDTTVVVTGTMRSAAVDAIRKELHGATHGEGFIEAHLDHYAPQRNR